MGKGREAQKGGDICIIMADFHFHMAEINSLLKKKFLMFKLIAVRWRRLFRVPWTARRSSQPILKEINPEYSLEGLTLRLKLQYSGHLMRTADSLEKTLMLGKIEGRRRRGWQRMRVLDSITDSMDMNEFEQAPGDCGGQRSLACCSPWGYKGSDMT